MPAALASARTLAAVIFDVDGVLVASPHERAWREALQGIADPARTDDEGDLPGPCRSKPVSAARMRS